NNHIRRFEAILINTHAHLPIIVPSSLETPSLLYPLQGHLAPRTLSPRIRRERLGHMLGLLAHPLLEFLQLLQMLSQCTGPPDVLLMRLFYLLFEGLHLFSQRFEQLTKLLFVLLSELL